MDSLKGKVALVTGAGRGIGRAIALQLGDAGAKVVAAARSVDELENITRELRESSVEAAHLECDLSDRENTQGLIDRAAQLLGPIDILVNNAGVGSSADPSALAEFSDDFWDLTLAVNLTAPYLLSKAALPHMRSQRWGRIITVASINGRIPAWHAGAYVASKHGVIGLMRTLALEHAAEGVTVNCVCPGPVRTRMNDIRVAYDADRLNRELEAHEQSLTPIGGRLTPEEVAPLARFLASDAARMITGQAYNVDGGICMA